MKERPILFSGSMVRAILEGRKAVTRRAMKPQPVLDGHFWTYGGAGWSDRINSITPVAGHSLATGCPYGQPGDRLWVRETWARVGTGDPGYLVYRATYPHCLPPGLENVPADIRDEGYRWRPSIHMQRSACRILLEITEVRVERLKDITEQQAIEEGVHRDVRKWFKSDEGGFAHDSATDAFADLWCTINGPCSWGANPWVWVVEFKRVTP